MLLPLKRSAPGAWHALLAMLAVVLALVSVADPSEARRVRFGSSGSSSSERIEKVYELPRIDELKLPDGRAIHIGRIKGGSDDGKLVGYVGPGREYLNLPYEQMTELVRHAGFDSVEALERHLEGEKTALVEKRRAEREAQQARAVEAAEERRRKRASAGGEPSPGQQHATGGGSGGGSGPGVIGGILLILVVLLTVVFGGVFSLWPLIVIGVVIWLVVRSRRAKSAPRRAVVPTAEIEGAQSAWVERSSRRMTQTAGDPAQATASARVAGGDFAALSGVMPVAVRYADGTTGTTSIENPQQLAAMLGKAPAAPARASVAQPVSRHAREGRIAQPRAFGKR